MTGKTALSLEQELAESRSEVERLSSLLALAKTAVTNLKADCEGAQAAAKHYLYERDLAKSQLQAATKRIVGIHSLMYPAPVTAPDGRVFVFRPKSPDPHEVLQELSDRIRALSEVLPETKQPAPPTSTSLRINDER